MCSTGDWPAPSGVFWLAGGVTTGYCWAHGRELDSRMVGGLGGALQQSSNYIIYANPDPPMY